MSNQKINLFCRGTFFCQNVKKFRNKKSNNNQKIY